MATFKTKIELKNPTEKELESVQQEMIKQGFVAGEKEWNTLFFLTPPHFIMEGSLQIHTVKELASTAARKAGLQVKISVSEST